ncbi:MULTISPECIES: PP2C family protein-serine/threonine phosphatase [Streptacidiphilus]|uniref:PP2C family protein-serine/threonine phosphatase n=1 Tax=Streptacidiphilus cavernicola TaxID=3342716 RepID=A0ABV6UJA6_9ACTN|nr:fused response regulator/phosphatase [Streptacidiphilus jeojiense]
MSTHVRAALTGALTGAGIPAQAAAPTESYRILLVEDDAGDALLVEELLADTGLTHSLTWTQTMAGALAELGGQTPDCVLLDLHLPDASGVGAIQTLEAACPHTAVIVLTGLAESRAGVQAVANGAQDYLVKGQVTADLLNRVVRYAVHRKQAERANAELRENRIHAQENTRLERGLLPAPLLHDDRVGAAMRYLPGRQRALLGGDFLDVVQTGGEGTVHAVIGDVSGHGPDEAALGVCLRITWRALVLAGHRGSELLGLLEQVLVAERPRDDMFATCSTVTLDPGERTATVYLAGHHEPLLCADGAARVVRAAHGPALGIVPGGGRWRPTEVPLPDKGALLLYTDGLIEGYRGPGKERLETEGLVELIARAPEQDPDPLLDHLIGTANTLNAGRHADDLAVLHLSWT